MALKDCENCLVYGTDNRPLAKARVEMTDENHIWLFFHYSKLRSIRIKTYVDFYDGQYGVVRSHCELVIQKKHSSQSDEGAMDRFLLHFKCAGYIPKAEGSAGEGESGYGVYYAKRYIFFWNHRQYQRWRIVPGYSPGIKEK